MPLRTAFAGLLTMGAIMGVGRFVYTPILPAMIESGALDRATAGWIAGANFLGYLVGALAAAAPFFQARQLVWCLAGIGLSIATTAAMGLEAGFWPMAFIRFASGLASAFGMIFITAIVMRQLAAAQRQGLIALHFGGVGIGIASSAVLVSLLNAADVGWPLQWLASALLALAAVGVALALLPPDQDGGRTVRVVGKAGFGLPLAVLTAGYALFGFGYVISATFINTMARTELALNPVEPYVWIVVGLSGLPSLLLWNALARRTSLSFAYIAACLVEAFGVFLPVIVLHPAALIAAAMMLGGTFMAITSLGFAWARGMKGGHDARAIAIMTAAFGSGQMAGPVVAGILYQRGGALDTASALAAAALLLAALLSIAAAMLDRSKRLAAS
jgi:predicted MFS family arabinose efflux permease